MLGYFIGLLIHPGRGLERLLNERPRLRRIVLFLAVLGLVRGLLDNAWLLLAQHQFQAFGSEMRLLVSRLAQTAPLLLADGLAAYIRWLGFAFVPYAVGRFMHGSGRLADFLRVYGAVMGIYVVTTLLNVVYFFAPLPMLRFQSAPAYSPTWGVGQILTSLWLGYISYRIVRRLHGLPRLDSMVIGFMVPALNLASLLVLGVVFYSALAVAEWPREQLGADGYGLFSVGSLVLLVVWIALSLWLVRRENDLDSASTDIQRING